MEGKFGDEWWKLNLRMKKDTFNIVCTVLRPYIEKQVSTKFASQLGESFYNYYITFIKIFILLHE